MKTFTALSLTFAGICAAVPPGASTSTPAFLDLNGDGVISEMERQAYEESRANARVQGGNGWDTNGDGIVDEDERQAAIAKLNKQLDAKVASLFLALAGDDALLTLDEFSTLPRFTQSPPEVAATLFNRLDADDDGFVTLAEFFGGTGRGGASKPTSRTR